MQYPKEVMKLKELMDMGFPRPFLERAFHEDKQTFAWKSISSSGTKYDILFDTEAFEKYRQKLCGTGR